MINRIIIYFLFFFTVVQGIFAQEGRRGHNWYTDNVIYGRDNAPDNIYYKYIQNHTSELFFYSTMSYREGSNNNNVIVILIIPYQSDEGILLQYNENWNYIRQFSLNYTVGHHAFLKTWAIVPAPLHKDAMIFFPLELYEYLLKQFEIEYRLANKKHLENLFANTFTVNAAVYVNRFTLDNPAYAQEP